MRLPSESFAVLIAFAALLPAQEAPPVKAEKPQRSAALVSLEFPGGTMTRFVAALREAQPKANVIVSKPAEDLLVPPVTVVQTTIGQALEAATLVSTGEDAQARAAVREFDGQGEPVQAVHVVKATARPSGGPGPEVRVRVFSLAKFTEPQAADLPSKPIAIGVTTILSAIENGTTGMMAAPRMRYHQDSGLLFVQGDDFQIEVVREVLRNLEEDQTRRRIDRSQAAQIEAAKAREAR